MLRDESIDLRPGLRRRSTGTVYTWGVGGPVSELIIVRLVVGIEEK